MVLLTYRSSIAFAAFNLAAHHASRRPLTSPSFLVSDVNETIEAKEAWHSIHDTQSLQQFCPRQYPPDSTTHPSIIHYPHGYSFKDFWFSKHDMNQNFFSCDAPLLEEPGDVLVTEADYKSAYFMCTLIPALNEAATHFKKHNCLNPQTINFEKTEKLVRHEVISEK